MFLPFLVDFNFCCFATVFKKNKKLKQQEEVDNIFQFIYPTEFCIISSYFYYGEKVKDIWFL